MARGERGRWRWGVLGGLAVLSAIFAYLNSGELTVVNLGFTVLYQVPLVSLLFAAFLLGMTTMFLLGLRHDLRVRRVLREHGIDPRGEAGRGREPEHEQDTMMYPFRSDEQL